MQSGKAAMSDTAMHTDIYTYTYMCFVFTGEEN